MESKIILSDAFNQKKIILEMESDVAFSAHQKHFSLDSIIIKFATCV